MLLYISLFSRLVLLKVLMCIIFCWKKRCCYKIFFHASNAYACLSSWCSSLTWCNTTNLRVRTNHVLEDKKVSYNFSYKCEIMMDCYFIRPYTESVSMCACIYELAQFKSHKTICGVYLASNPKHLSTYYISYISYNIIK